MRIALCCTAVGMLLLSSVATAQSLNQAAYVSGSTKYEFGYNSIPNIPVTDAPTDTDWKRWAMLHDGTDFRLYFFKRGSADTLYQFGFNAATSAYEYGYRSIPVLTIVGAPGDADASSFAMLHDGTTYRLYLRPAGRPDQLYQFGFNPGTNNYEFGFNSIQRIQVVDAPEDVDWDRWAMLHDGTTFRYYAFQAGSNDQLYQAAFDPAVSQYKFGFNSIPVMTLVGAPANSDTGNAGMLHDSGDFRFYFRAN